MRNNMITNHDETVSVTLKIPEMLYQQIEVLFPEYHQKNIKKINNDRLLENILTNALNKAAKSYREFNLNLRKLTVKKYEINVINSDKVNNDEAY